MNFRFFFLFLLMICPVLLRAQSSSDSLQIKKAHDYILKDITPTIQQYYLSANATMQQKMIDEKIDSADVYSILDNGELDSLKSIVAGVSGFTETSLYDYIGDLNDDPPPPDEGLTCYKSYRNQVMAATAVYLVSVTFTGGTGAIVATAIYGAALAVYTAEFCICLEANYGTGCD